MNNVKTNGLTFILTILYAALPGWAVAQEPYAIEADGGYVLPGTQIYVPGSLANEIELAREQLESVGFVDHTSKLSQGQYALARIEQRSSEARANEELGYYDLDIASNVNFGRSLATVARDAILPGSKNFLIPNGKETTRLFTKTSFGTLLVREMPDTRIIAPDSALDHYIGTHKVFMSTIKYHGNTWTTVILAEVAGKTYFIEAGIRISSKGQEMKFMRFVQSILDS